MTKLIYILLLFTSLIVFGQQSQSTEDLIYNAVDNLTANPSEESLRKIETFSKSITTNSKNKNEQLALVVLYCNKAYYENKFGKITNAVYSYEKAWHIYQKNKLSNYDITEFCLKPLGNLYTIIGDYDNAENTIKQYYFLATQEKNQTQKYAAVLNLSNVYQNTGRVNEAIDLIEKTISKEKLSNVQRGILLNNLGSNYFLTFKGFLPKPALFAKTENYFLKSILLLEKDKAQYEALANAYSNLSRLKLERNDLELALKYFEKAKVAFEKTNPSIRKRAQFFLDEATILFKQGKLKEANAILSSVFKILIPDYSNQKKVLPNRNSLFAETLLLDALDLQAELFLEESRPKKALESYALSFYIEDLFQSLLVYENSKIITQIRNRNRTEKCIAIYQSLFEKEHKISYLENAFLLAEKTKSVVLKESLTKNKNQSKEEKLIFEQLQNWNTIIIKEQQKGESANISTINEAIKRQNELMLIIKENKFKKSYETKPEIDLKALYTKLQIDNAIMVEYFSGYLKTYSFTIIDKKIFLNSISNNAETSVKISQFIDYFTDANSITNDISGYNHYGNLAYKLLKLPTNPSYKNLIIVPDGILNFLPFDALITQESSTTNFAKMHYLSNDYRIGYNSSVAFYLSDVEQKRQRKKVLGIFPVFENTAYALTYSKREMEAIKNKFDGKYFENATATFENFKKNAADYSILHLSTHASSGDIVTPASIKFYDQEILYSELYNLNIKPDLVVLSACETGIGKLYKSEGAMSVARGFQFAGAKNLLFSLWKVNDYTTSVFMDKFYTNLKNGSSYLEANHQAKLDFLADKSISNAKKSPYYWSAFVYYGSLEKESTTANYIYYAIGFLILISLFLIYIYKRK